MERNRWCTWLIYDSAVTKCPTWTGENRRITTRIECGDYPLNPRPIV